MICPRDMFFKIKRQFPEDLNISMCLIDTMDPEQHARPVYIHPLSGLSSPVSPVGQLNRDVEEDDVFMQLELPLERDSGSSGESSPLGETSPPPVSSTPSRDALMPDLYPQVFRVKQS